MANAKGGIVIIGVEDSTHKVVGVPNERIGETMDIILRAARQVIKPELLLDPPEPEVYDWLVKSCSLLAYHQQMVQFIKREAFFGYGRGLKPGH